MRTVGLSGMPFAGLPWAEQREILTGLGDVTLALSMNAFAEADPAELPHELTESGLRITSLGSALLTPADSPHRDRLRRETDMLMRAVDLAAAIGTPIVATTIGPAGHLRWEDALDQRQHDLARVLAHARACGVRITLENTHSLRSEVGFLHTLRDTVAAARQLGTGVCADLYCCWAERGLAETLVDGTDVIWTAQYADFVHGTMTQPNRWVPGDGDLPVDNLVAAVVVSGFTGTHEVELVGPRIDAEGPVRAVRRAVDWLRSRLETTGAGVPDDDPTERLRRAVAALRGRSLSL